MRTKQLRLGVIWCRKVTWSLSYPVDSTFRTPSYSPEYTIPLEYDPTVGFSQLRCTLVHPVCSRVNSSGLADYMYVGFYSRRLRAVGISRMKSRTTRDIPATWIRLSVYSLDVRDAHFSKLWQQTGESIQSNDGLCDSIQLRKIQISYGSHGKRIRAPVFHDRQSIIVTWFTLPAKVKGITVPFRTGYYQCHGQVRKKRSLARAGEWYYAR